MKCCERCAVGNGPAQAIIVYNTAYWAMGYSLLIADDLPSDLYLLVEYFRSAGFTVYSASNCAEAIARAGEHDPDCFLLDYYMDARGGAEEICEYLHSNEKFRLKPVIIRSGDHTLAMQSYGSCDADGYVCKDSPFEELLVMVMQKLRHAEKIKGLQRSADLTLDEKNQLVIREKYRPKKLSPDQFKLFSLLFARRGRFVSEAEIYRLLYGKSDVDSTASLKALACRLRDRLGSQLAQRIEKHHDSGWIYVEPRIHDR